jgi:dihydrofolate synthase / folylpolyglutamate synthase
MNNSNNIESALKYLHTLKSGVADPKNSGYQINRITKYLEYIGNPQYKYPVIHIGGTAGKGSTSIMTAQILSKLGLKVGLHTSPYLVSINEKFQIVENGRTEDCSDNTLLSLINEFETNHKKYIGQNNEPLTFYEAIIALIFEYFRLQAVDVAVIEVAMGGRLDATNVVNSDVAILNSVGMDHMEFLGDTLEKIAWDKMHIIKPNKKFVCGITIPNIVEMIAEHAKSLNSSTSFLNKEFEFEIINSDENGSKFNFWNQHVKFEKINLPLFGIYQVHNAALAIEGIFQYLQDKNSLTSEIINRAFENLRIKGRFDVIRQNPLIILDGAHNELKMNGLVNSILSTKLFEKYPKTLMIGFKKGKDASTMIKKLLELKPEKIFVTEFAKANSPNTFPLSVEEIQEILIANNFLEKNIYLEREISKAYEQFSNSLNRNSFGLATGSLYLLGNIYTNLK